MLGLYAGSDSTFVVTPSVIYVFGDNTFGTLGLGATNLTFITLPAILPPIYTGFTGADVLKISSALAQGKHTILLTKKGDVYVTGRFVYLFIIF